MLLDFLLSEFDLDRANHQEVVNLQSDLLKPTPRHISLNVVYGGPGKVQREISWEVPFSKYFSPGFHISIYPASYGEESRKDHLYYDGAVPAEEASPMADPVGELSSSNSESSAPTPTSSEHAQSTTSDHPIWQGNIDGKSHTLDLAPLMSTSLSHGKKYVAILRSNLPCFYGLPFHFEILYPRPYDLQVRRHGTIYTVAWDYPLVDSTARFIVECTSMYDTIHTAEGIQASVYTFEAPDDALTMDLEFTVQAIFEDGESGKTMIELEAGGGEQISPSTSPGPCVSPDVQSKSVSSNDGWCGSTSPIAESDDYACSGGYYDGCGYRHGRTVDVSLDEDDSLGDDSSDEDDDSDEWESAATEFDDDESSDYTPEETRHTREQFPILHHRPIPASVQEVRSYSPFLTCVGYPYCGGRSPCWRN
jgi:hypothetical protein